MAAKQEKYSQYLFEIELPDNTVVPIQAVGVTEYHAKQNAYAKACDIQPDLSKYTYIPSLMNKIVVR